MADDKPNVTGAVEAPNYTPTPNAFFDTMLPAMSSVGELKVTLVIIRQTFGWVGKDGARKMEDQLSVTRLMALTGLARQSVMDGVKAGLERGTILRRRCGAQDYKYRLNVAPSPVKKVDRSKKQTSPESRPVPVQNLDQSPVQNLDPQKKDEKKERKEESANALPALTSSADPAETGDTAKTKNEAVSYSKHPAVKAYQEKYLKYPRKELHPKLDADETVPEMQRIAERVGESPERIEIWKAVMDSWSEQAIGHNISVKHDKAATKWNPGSVKALLDAFTNRMSEVDFEQKQKDAVAERVSAPADRRGLRTITIDGQTVTLAAPRA